MTNLERKNYHFQVAEVKYKEMLARWKAKDWNMVIRNAQEVIECYLKGVLKFMNIEFPKEHDIGWIF